MKINKHLQFLLSYIASPFITYTCQSIHGNISGSCRKPSNAIRRHTGALEAKVLIQRVTDCALW